MDNLINGVGVGEPVVNISDNIHADITEQVPGLDILGEGSLAEASDSEESEDLEHDVVVEVLDVDLNLSETETSIYT